MCVTLFRVYKEARKALYSIFNESDLNEFTYLSSNTKERQLVELAELTTGIRLFNRDCHKGGKGIEDLPTLLNDAIATTIGLIEQRLMSIMSSVNMLTTAIDNSYATEYDMENNWGLTLTLPSGACEEDINNFKDVLIVYRQYEMYIRLILVEVEKIEKEAKTMFGQFQQTLVELHEVVKYRVIIPTANVFPLFTQLAREWCELQNLTILISHLNQMLVNLHTFTNALKIDAEKLRLVIGTAEVLNDAERLDRTAHLEIAPFRDCNEAALLSPAGIGNFDNMKFEYLGFCPWKMVETDGGLIPGNPNMGVAQVKNLCFSFSSVEAAAAFGQSPQRYIFLGIDLARTKLELINLLGLKQQLEAVRRVSLLVQEIPPAILKTDETVQTDLHATQTSINPNYKWNVWDCKRQAILLANLSMCQTQGTQTEKSQSRKSIQVQTYSPREVVVQTKRDNYTNVPALSNFIYGLRGRKDNAQHIITLTRPIDE